MVRSLRKGLFVETSHTKNKQAKAKARRYKWLRLSEGPIGDISFDTDGTQVNVVDDLQSQFGIRLQYPGWFVDTCFHLTCARVDTFVLYVCV
jgi:hypothetical protein